MTPKDFTILARALGVYNAADELVAVVADVCKRLNSEFNYAKFNTAVREARQSVTAGLKAAGARELIPTPVPSPNPNLISVAAQAVEEIDPDELERYAEKLR